MKSRVDPNKYVHVNRQPNRPSTDMIPSESTLPYRNKLYQKVGGCPVERVYRQSVLTLSPSLSLSRSLLLSLVFVKNSDSQTFVVILYRYRKVDDRFRSCSVQV